MAEAFPLRQTTSWMVRPALLCVLAAVLTAGGARGQFPLAGPTVVEFSFSNPGARSMGLGGAFVALADDATAAFANPAGLVQLTRPEVSVEGRLWSYSTSFTSGGRLIGEPTGRGLDNSLGLQTGESKQDLSGLSFLSLVYPKKRWSLAFYRHQLANFESFTETQALFGPGSLCCQERYPDVRIATDLAITSYGVSVAYRVGERLSVGGSVVYFEGAWDLVGENFFPDDDSPESEFLEGSFLPSRSFIRTDIDLEDTDWGLTLGVLWRFADNWRLGAVLRQGPAFQFGAVSRIGQMGPAFDLAPGSLLVEQTSPVEYPDVFGLGIAYRSTGGRLTVAFEWDQIGYSDIILSQNPELEIAGLVIDDGTELHLGSEYVFLGSTPLIGLRIGVWHDTDHGTRYEGSDAYRRSLLPGGEDAFHYAAGLGLAFDRFQIDLGVDFSEPVDTASLSLIYSF